MKKTIQITEEAVLKAHKEAGTKGKSLLENLFENTVFKKDIKERIKTLDDAINVLGSDDVDVKNYRDMVSGGLQNHIIGNQELVIITKALNEGWMPDWHNGEWDIWMNWFNMSSSSSGRFSFFCSVLQRSYSCCGSRLCFKSEELAQYAAKQFINTYKKAYTI